MILRNISILNYKNIGEAKLDFSSKFNCFIGNNGEGKTNLLDAIYYLSFCHSMFSNIDSLLMKHDTDFFMIQGEYLHDDGETEDVVYAGMKRGVKKTFKRNNKNYKRLSEHIGIVPLIIVSPDDASLILGGSEERRRLLDIVISQYDNNYINSLNRYNKALQQRNALLKMEDVEPDPTLLSLWEEEMAHEGEYIYQQRNRFVESFMPVFNRVYQSISDGKEEVTLRYVSHCQRGPLLEVIQRDRHKDIAVGHSLHGIHRDDIEMLIDGYPMKREGSQGQNKTYVISLKLAQFDFLCNHNLDNNRNHNANTPLLLLDDIFDKLDAHRVQRIVQLVSSNSYGQIFITDTNRDHLDQILSQSDAEYKIFHVEGGAFTVHSS